MSSDAKRVAVITGASRGIGRAIAKRLARDGRHVVLLSRSEGPLRDLCARIEGEGGSATVRTVDVAHGPALSDAIASVGEQFGRLDILVNNAGITRDGLILRMSDEDWEQVLRVNLTAAFVAIRAAARLMMKNRFGRIVNISSTSGVAGNAGQANYAAAKAGLIGLSRTVARELGGKGITCNVIAPGFIETDMTADLPQTVRENVLNAMAVKRFGTPEDVAAAVGYVTSDEAGFLTGQVICVDGGLTMA